jgi:energy-coupling factor transporter transmembrane protein EcfT
LANQIFQSARVKAAIGLTNILFCFALVVVFTFDLKLIDVPEAIAILVVSVVALVYIIMFTFINNSNFTEIIGEKIEDFELLQYKTMFNCLQEGILVLDGKKF